MRSLSLGTGVDDVTDFGELSASSLARKTTRKADNILSSLSEPPYVLRSETKSNSWKSAIVHTMPLELSVRNRENISISI